MTRFALKGCMTALVLALAASVAHAAPPAPLPGVVRVKLQPEVATALSSTPIHKAARGEKLRVGVEPLDASLSQIKGTQLRRAFPCPPGREAAHAEFGLDRWYEVQFDASVDPLEARRVLRGTPGVELASERRPMKLYEEGNYRMVDPNSPAPRATTKMPFNDPRLPQQWHYHNDGSMAGSKAGADINLFEAWKIATGSPNVIVAVVDGGIDYTHEDLADAMWVNEAELNGVEGVDDDGDGYIDNIYGYNFCTMSGEIYPHAHGTHVAGTIGARNGNGTGVCGVAGGDGTPGSGVKLMSCQVFDGRSGTGEGDFAAALIYAADKGATIANCSWGWGYEDYYEPDVLEAIRYFTRTARSGNMSGGLCIVASGNEGATGAFYPGCMPEVLAVGAMCYDLTPASYSNYGDWVDVTAPGGLVDYDSAQGVLSTMPGGGYGYNEGTSMATPHVSGIAALVLSKYGAPTMINENLRQQIVTSVNDLYALAPQVEGLFGSGYVDAWKALQWGDGTAPDRVADLRVVTSQDNAQLSWTIPNSSDSNVNSHIIYYLNEPFTADMLDECEMEVVDTKFHSSGDPFTYEVTGLKPLTTYYFAVVAVDRWSNASEVSDIVSATTNAGPALSLSRTVMNLRTTDGETWTSSSFDVGNTDEGLLRWKADLRTFSSSISAYSTAKGLMTAPYAGHLAIEPFDASKNSDVPVVSIEGFEQEDFPQVITAVKSLYAFIGDTETSNSMAQLFTVDPTLYPDGFNLTHVFMLGTNGKNPTIEVYKNTGTLSNSTLLESMKVTSNNPYYSDLPLNESLWFAPGESFYVVVHFTEYGTRNYTLGLALSNGASFGSQSYISSDLGKTWSLLSAALKDSSYESIASQATWGITAKSLYPDWSQIICLDPAEGTVEAGQKQTVSATHNGTHVPNGSYRARIHFDTNETNPTGKTINVNLTVSGNKPVVDYSKVVKFGNLLVGQTKTITIQLTNTGYGAFAGSTTSAGLYAANISSTSPMFAGPKSVTSGIPARSTVSVDLTYAPTEAGSHSGQIVFTDKAGQQIRITVQGAATDPAKLAIEPSEIEVGTLVDGDEPREVSFAITNAGNYPLQFVMPKFTDSTLDEVASDDTHCFGYTWESNLYGSTAVSYDGLPVLVDATDIKSQFSDYVYFSKPIDIGFEFPFYGKTYDKVYVSSLGTLSFDTYTEGSIYSPIDHTKTTYLKGLGVIGAYGFQCQFSPTSRVEYAKQDGNFVVNFKDVLVSVYASDFTPASFHVVLSPNGDIRISFDFYDPQSVFEKGRNLWVGIVDPAMEDPMTITSASQSSAAIHQGDTSESVNRWRYIASGTSFVIHAPQPEMIRSVEPALGMVSPGESVEVKAVVSATDDMYEGSLTSNLVILSNDIVNPTSILRFKAEVTGDLRPELTLGADRLDFGKVFRTAVVKRPVAVRNTGRADMTVTAVSLAEGRFTHDFTAAVTVPAGQSKDILVAIPTAAEGAVADRMTIVTSAGEATVDLAGEVIGVPQAQLSYTSINETLPSGEAKAMPLVVSNPGNEPLVYSIVPAAHVSFQPEFEEGSQTDYSYVASIDDSTAARDWVDINTNGLGQQYNYTYFLGRDYVEVELPFEFNFYGKTYTTMYVYNAGFVSFTKRKDEAIWPEPPTEFPGGSIYDNLIAPYWGLHTMDITATAGVFTYAAEDQAVVSYIEYGNSMNIGVNYQVIIRPDGSFTFNYRPANAYAEIFASFGLAGICDGEGNGTQLPDRYITLGNTVNFYPVVESTLAPGEERVADITLTADALAGDYSSQITMSTNVPASETIRIPVQLKVTGEARPQFPDDITVEQVAGYRNTDASDELISYFGARWYVPVEVANLGTAAFTVDKVEMICPKVDGFNMFSLYYYGTYMDEWFGVEKTGWTTYAGQSVTVGTSPLRLAIPVTSSDYSYLAWQTPGTYDITLRFHLSGLGDLTTRDVNVKLVILEQPALTVDTDEIVVTRAAADLVTDRSFTVSNAAGGSKLVYSIQVDPTGQGAEVPEAEEASSLALRTLSASTTTALSAGPVEDAILPEAVVQSAPMVAAVGKSDNVFDCPEDTEDFPYNRALYHPALPGSTVAYNYGTTNTYSVFKAATAFVGPEGGFNISHIYSCMHPYGLSNTDVTIEIYNGDPQVSTDVLGSGTYHLGEVTSQQYQNVRFIAKLDTPVYISEGQLFYLVITYPVGQPYPSTLVVKEDAVTSNRYLAYWENYGWFDVAALFQSQYGSLGYLATCIETVEGDGWVKLLDADGNVASRLDDELANGEEHTVSVRLNAANAPKELDNRAVLILRSNDPKATVVNIPVRLDKNARPQVVGPTSAISVAENSTVTVPLTVLDPEGDDFSVRLDDNGKMSVISKIVDPAGVATIAIADDGLSATVSGAPGAVNVSVAITAPYEAAGNYGFTLSAADLPTHESAANVAYTVTHTNRAPVANTIADMAVAVGTTTPVIDLTTLFTDPDGDALTYSFGYNRIGYLTRYDSGDNVIFLANREGKVKVTITAADPDGAKASTSFTVEILDPSGVDDPLAATDQVSVYPNPVVDRVNVSCSVAGATSVKVYSLAGAEVLTADYENSPSAPYTIEASQLAAGPYIIKVTTADRRVLRQLLIKN